MSSASFVVDHIVLVCNGCKVERTFWLDAPITSAEQLIEWMKTKPPPCVCGAKTCDVKAHLKGE